MRHFIYASMLAIAAASFLLTPSGSVAEETTRQEYLRHVRDGLMRSPVVPRRGQPLALTLEECLRLALAHNAKLAAADFAIDAAQAQQDEARARWWPVIDYEYRSAPVPKNLSTAASSFFSGDLVWFQSASVRVGVPVYTFGKLTSAQQLAEHGSRAAHQQKRKAAANVVSQTRKLYYGIQLGEEIAKVAKEAIDRLSERIEYDAEQSRSRQISPVEKLRMQLARAEIEKRLSVVRTRQHAAVGALQVQLGLQPDRPVMVAHRALHPRRVQLASLDTYVSEALASRPDARLVDVGVDAKRLEYQLERQKMLPDVGVGGFLDVGRTVGTVGGTTSTDDFTHPFHYTRAGIGVQVKGRFDAHGGKSRVRRKRNEYFKTRVERMLAKDGIRLDVDKAFHEAQAARQQIERADEGRQLARRMLFLTRSNNELGIGNHREYAEAIQALLLTQKDYFESVFAWNGKLADLDEKIGWIPYAHTSL